MALAAIVIIFAIGELSGPYSQAVEQPATEYNNAQSSQNDTVHFGVLKLPDTLAQWFAAIASVASIFVSVWAVRLVQRTLQESKRTANAAVENNRISRTNSNEQSRAYVGVESISLDCPSAGLLNYTPAKPVPGVAITDFIVLDVKNFGATPANNLHTWVNWFVAPFPQGLPQNFNYPDVVPLLPPDIEVSPIETTVFPTQTFKSKIAMHDVTPVILTFKRLVFVYYYGRIAYRDMTGTQRYTYFCYRHDVVSGNKMEPYGPYNYAT